MIHSFDEFKEIPVDYDSPINMVVEQMASEIAKFTDDGVMQAVVKAGFDIDKDKLVRILQQDRERYQEAYRKGYKARKTRLSIAGIVFIVTRTATVITETKKETFIALMQG